MVYWKLDGNNPMFGGYTQHSCSQDMSLEGTMVKVLVTVWAILVFVVTAALVTTWQHDPVALEHKSEFAVPPTNITGAY